MSAFPGYGDSAPLDLSGITARAEAGIIARITDGSFEDFGDTAAKVGYCTRPVRLSGHSVHVDPATGEVLGRACSSSEMPLGVLYRPCGNRRAHLCPACARTYQRDCFAMVSAGVSGGKTVPATVADNPLLFITLTAPSFGHVHGGRCGSRPRKGEPCPCPHGRPRDCHRHHEDNDPLLGAALCTACYDWDSAVIWQWFAPELWRRFTIAMRRALAKVLHVKQSRLKWHASVQYAKVAEYQARGLIHFHALIRLDGANGPGSPAPLDGDAFAEVIRTAVARTEYVADPVDGDDIARTLAFGRQLDVRTVRQGRRTDVSEEPLTPEQVAGYLAKYATKDADSIRLAQPRPHLIRLRDTTKRLSTRAEQHQRKIRLAPEGDRDQVGPYALLGHWAHMYGFRGHFTTKSRRYSITLGALRRARRNYAARIARGEDLAGLDVRDLEDLLLADDEETTLVVGSWTYLGTGWTTPGDEELALAAANRAREYDQWRADQKRSQPISGRNES